MNGRLIGLGTLPAGMTLLSAGADEPDTLVVMALYRDTLTFDRQVFIMHNPPGWWSELIKSHLGNVAVLELCALNVPEFE